MLKRNRDYTELGYLVGAARLGIEPSEYRRHREAGLRWCGFHTAWEPETAFRFYPQMRYPWRANCAEGERIQARESMRRRRAAWRAAS